MTIACSAPVEDDDPEGTCDHAGRVDVGLLKSFLPFDDYDFHVLRPPAFMTSVSRRSGIRCLYFSLTRGAAFAAVMASESGHG